MRRRLHRPIRERPRRYGPGQRRLIYGNLPLVFAITLALAMLVGHQFPTGAVEPAAAPAGGGTTPPAEELAAQVDRAQVDRAQARLDPWMRPLAPGEKPPQFVLFSFDGVGSHEHWQRIMEIAGQAEARVTGFLSGVYLLSDEQRDRYQGPGHAPGRSSIGFGGSPEEVSTLIDDLNQALDRGHEIGTHYNGHFCAGAGPSGADWSTAMWNDELDQFFAFVEGGRAQGLRLDPSTVRGGRTPCLEGDWAQANPAMIAHGMTYDTSRISDGIAWPSDEGGIREFWMPLVRIPALDKKVTLMDYNLWFSLNGARDEPERAAEFAEVTLSAYRAAYDAAFTQNRAPLVIGNHFNSWSGGGFSRAVEQFMAEVCLRPETVCATYSEVGAWMDLQDPAVLQVWRDLPNAQVAAG